MEKKEFRIVRSQPTDWKGLLNSSTVRSAPTGIRGGGGSYFHL